MPSFTRRTLALSALLLVLAPVIIAFAASKAPAADAAWQKSVLAWRADYEKDLRAPTGWLTLVGLEWLKPGDNAFGAAQDNAIKLKPPAAPHMGTVRLTGTEAKAPEKLELLAPAGGFPKDLKVDGHAPANPQTLEPDTSGHPSKLTLASLTITVIHRGEQYALRIKDSQSPVRTRFPGLKWYAPDPAYRVRARWVPYDPPKKVMVPTVLGTEVPNDVPGAAEFTLDGQTLRLEPMVDSPTDKDLFFVLRDTTSTSTTYGAGRFLDADAPKDGLSKPGEIWLDFNEAHNPPCAYTRYATCPLPTPQNRLKVAVPAGEKRFHE